MKNEILILLIATDGYRRKSLHTSLHSIPRVSVLVSDNLSDLLKTREALLARLILIDSSVSYRECEQLRKLMKNENIHIPCVYLAESNGDQRKSPCSLTDGVIYKNTSAVEFVEQVKAYIHRSRSSVKDI